MPLSLQDCFLSQPSTDQGCLCCSSAFQSLRAGLSSVCYPYLILLSQSNSPRKSLAYCYCLPYLSCLVCGTGRKCVCVQMCTCVCVFACENVCTRMCMYVCYVYMCARVCMYVLVHMCVRVCMCIHMFMGVCICAHVCMCTYVHKCVHECMTIFCVHTCIRV